MPIRAGRSHLAAPSGHRGRLELGAVARAPLAGGATTTLATNQPYPGGIAVDGTSVYWVNGGTNTSLSTDGTVMKLTPK
jgi:hypothetical protein